jgi:acyl-CoA synthetase (AMP-forming)/AMP-acid ligase II
LSLEELRLYLRSKLSNYKMHTLLRIVPELKKTASMKIPKMLLKKTYLKRDIQMFRSGLQRVPKSNWEL